MDRVDETAREGGRRELHLAYELGLTNNEIKWILTLRRVLGHDVEDEQRLSKMSVKHLNALSAYLVELVRGRLLPPKTAADESRLRAVRDRLWEFDSVFDEVHHGGAETN